MGNSNSHLGQKNHDSAKSAKLTFEAIKSKSVDNQINQVNRVVRTRPLHEDPDAANPGVPEPKKILGRHESKNTTAIKVIPNIIQIQSAPFILSDERHNSQSNPQSMLGFESMVNNNGSSSMVTSSENPFAGLRMTTFEGDVEILEDNDFKAVVTNASQTPTHPAGIVRNNSRHESFGGTPVLKRTSTGLKAFPTVSAIEQSGDLPLSIDASLITTQSSLEKAMFMGSTEALGSTSRSNIFSKSYTTVESSASLVPSHRWSTTDPHA